MTPDPVYNFRLTIDTNNIDIYYLSIISNKGTETLTVKDYVYSNILPMGEYHIEACYWTSDNVKRCEGQRVWLDEDTTVYFFVEVQDEI